MSNSVHMMGEGMKGNEIETAPPVEATSSPTSLQIFPAAEFFYGVYLDMKDDSPALPETPIFPAQKIIFHADAFSLVWPMPTRLERAINQIPPQKI